MTPCCRGFAMSWRCGPGGRLRLRLQCACGRVMQTLGVPGGSGCKPRRTPGCESRVISSAAAWKDTVPPGASHRQAAGEDRGSSRKMPRRTTLRGSADITEEAPIRSPE